MKDLICKNSNMKVLIKVLNYKSKMKGSNVLLESRNSKVKNFY